MSSKYEYQAPIIIRTYDDLLLRRKFEAHVDPKQHVPQTILTTYEFPQLRQCGLTSCHHWHKEGALFETADGIEGHMGHDCAAKLLPNQYGRMMNEYRSRRATYSQMDVIDDFMRRHQEHHDAVLTLWNAERGGQWGHICYKRFHERCPEFVRRAINDMARSGVWSIWRDVRIDSENALSLGFRKGEASLEKQKLADLHGGMAFKMSPGAELLNLLEKINVYAQLEPREQTSAFRRQWATWIKLIPSKLSTANTLINAARVCYTPENLSNLYQLARRENQRAEIRDLLRAIESVRTTPNVERKAS